MSQVLVNLWLSCPAFRQTRSAKATPSPRKAQPQIDFAGPRAPYYGCRVFFRRSLGPRGLHGLVVRWCHWCGVPSYKFRVVQHAWSMVMMVMMTESRMAQRLVNRPRKACKHEHSGRVCGLHSVRSLATLSRSSGTQSHVQEHTPRLNFACVWQRLTRVHGEDEKKSCGSDSHCAKTGFINRTGPIGGLGPAFGVSNLFP